MSGIHPTAQVAPGARVDPRATLGPFCMVGSGVTLEAGVHLVSHVAVAGNTRIGEGTRVYPFASIGHPPQAVAYKGEDSRLEIGAHNVIREHVTMNPGTCGGGMITRVGSGGIFMAGCHVAHDCIVGDNVIVSVHAGLGGHCQVADNAIISALSGLNPFTRVGRHAFVGAMSAVPGDIAPFAAVAGNRARMAGINAVGLKRNGFSDEQMRSVRAAYRLLFSGPGAYEARLGLLEEEFAGNALIMEIVEFVRSGGKRPLCVPRRAADPGADASMTDPPGTDADMMHGSLEDSGV